MTQNVTLDPFARAEQVLVCLLYSATGTAFTILIWHTANRLIEVGLAWGAWALLGAYFVASIPIWLAQLGAAADLLLVLITGSAHVVPALCTAAERATSSWPMYTIAAVLTAGSPFSALAAFAWGIAGPSARGWDQLVVRHRVEARALSLAGAQVARLLF
jgi:hypothetical protein